MGYRFFRLFYRALRMCAYFLVVFVPILLGTCFLAHAIWSPHIYTFSSWTETFLTTLLGVYQPFPAVMEMHDKGIGWALPFLLYFTLFLSAFMIHMVLAIMIHSYFEVELVEGSDPKSEQWSKDQWLDWALWAHVYRRFTGKKAGASRIAGCAEADDQDDEDEFEGDSDEER